MLGQRGLSHCIFIVKTTFWCRDLWTFQLFHLISKSFIRSRFKCRPILLRPVFSFRHPGTQSGIWLRRWGLLICTQTQRVPSSSSPSKWFRQGQVAGWRHLNFGAQQNFVKHFITLRFQLAIKMHSHSAWLGLTCAILPPTPIPTYPGPGTYWP